MSMDRSKNSSRFDFTDTWDNYEERDFSNVKYEQPSNHYENATPASMESIVSAFSQSNAMQALREDSRANYSNAKFVNLQNKQNEQRPMNATILPQTVRNESMFEGNFFGSLGVESQIESGSMTDRLGKTYTVYQSQFPPPEKDHKNTSADTSDRRLEKLGVFVKEAKKKSEVAGEVNPREEYASDRQSVVRSNNMEMNSRETFFNKNGLQPVPEFEQSREMYDGYNWKSGHETRTFPLENSWRDDLTKPVSVRKSSVSPDKRMNEGLESKRKEISSTFRVKNANQSNPIGISAKNTRISLPVLNEATIRCEPVPQVKSPHIAYDKNFERFAEHNTIGIENGRLEESLDVKKSNDNLNVSSMKADLDHLNYLRENGAVEPKPSREWASVRKIVEAIDHNDGDDTEVENIMNNGEFADSSRQIYESTDHSNGNELPSQAPRAMDLDYIPGSNIRSDIHEDEKREMNMQQKPADNSVLVSARKANISLNGTDSQIIENKLSNFTSVPNTMVFSEQNIEENNRQIESHNLAQPLIGVSNPIKQEIIVNENDREQHANVSMESNVVPNNIVYSKITVNDNNRQQNGVEKQGSIEAHSKLRENIEIDDTRRQLEGEKPRTDSIYFEPISSHITIQENNRQNHQQESLTSVLNPANTLDPTISLPVKNRQQNAIVSSKSSTVQHEAIDPNIQLKHERKTIEGRMIGSIPSNKYMTTGKISLPVEDRATYASNRPGFVNSQKRIHSETSLADNNRNNTSNRKMMIQSDNAGNIMSNHEDPLKIQNSMFSHTNNGQFHGHTRQMQSDVRVKESEETGSFARTNGMHSSLHAMHLQVENTNAKSGEVIVDRIHAPHSQDWRRNEIRVKQGSESKEERATPCRSPSRTYGSDARLTPALQSDSRREICERAPSAHSMRSTPLLGGIISRNESNDCY